MNIKRLLLLCLFLISNSTILSQFKINQLSSGIELLTDSLFLETTETRYLKSLNGNWKVFFADEPENFSEVDLPATFTSDKEIILERKFETSVKEISSSFIKLNFLGINYTAEIYVNNTGIYKHPGGEIPFSIDLPIEILNYDTQNTLRIKIQYNIDSRNTIPLHQRFLFPKNYGGILRDIFLSFSPRVGIEDLTFALASDRNPYEGRMNIDVKLHDFTNIVKDSLLDNHDGRFKIEALLTKTSDTSRVYFNIWNIKPLNKTDFIKDFYVRLRNIYRWSHQSPVSYILSLKLTNGDGYVFDHFRKTITIMDITKEGKKLFINNENFKIKGVTYIRSLDANYNYQSIDNDIKKIKETGFNTVRFSKSIPHPYAVHLCKKYGLYALIELPLNSVPERFTEDSNFEKRVFSFMGRTIEYYDKYQNVLAYGPGGSFLSSSNSHADFVTKTSAFIRRNSSDKFSYVSSIGTNDNNNIDIDLYGLELFASKTDDIESWLLSESSSDSLIYFISETTYPTYKGATNGYLNKYSYEGQAKYFDDVLNLVENSLFQGFVINSMYDYEGDFTSLFSGFNEQNLYNIGIYPNEDNQTRISYNLIKSKLLSGSNITVPIGSNEEDAPMLFIIAALAISVIIALLINSKRKFREDATRALLRPYNFFADIRDQRIMSGFHSNILILLLAGANALLVTILLHFLKSNILLEKIILSFGNQDLLEIVGFLAWNPEKAFIYLYIATIALFIVVSFLVHLSSFFVKTRVLFSSVYAVMIWSFLPLALLLPIEAVLYKILQLYTWNNFIYILLIIFLVWNVQRFLKGIYVIFDVRPLLVYSYAFLTMIIFLVAVGFYFQYTVSAYDYVSLAIKQYMNL